MSHDIWEEGTGCSKCEAEHQDGYNALCVKESDKHGGQAHQTHDDFCNLHDGLAGRIRLQHCLIDVIGKDGACAKEIGVELDMVAEMMPANRSPHIRAGMVLMARTGRA